MRAWEALLLAASIACTRSVASLITGLDSSNSILRAFDLMWGWHSRAHSRGRGAVRRGRIRRARCSLRGMEASATPR